MPVQAQEIKDNLSAIERVFNSLQSVEDDAEAHITKTYLDPQARLNTENLENNQFNYLAIRLQREKLEKIKAFISLYHNSFCNNFFHLDRFYSESFQTFFEELPNPKDDLNRYIDTLITKIKDEKHEVDRKALIQFAIGLAIAVVGFSLIITALAAAATTVNFYLFLVGFPIGVALLFAGMGYSGNTYRNQREMTFISQYLQADCLPKLEPTHYSIKLNAKQEQLSAQEISVYLDKKTNNIMCCVCLSPDPTFAQHEVFSITLDDKTLKTEIMELLSTLSNPAIQRYDVTLTDIHKKALFAAINQREFHRYLTCTSGFETEDMGEITTKRLMQGQPIALSARFFQPASFSNTFGADAVQEKMNESKSPISMLR